ncbi:MAG: nucleotidyl transferase AbiEii/AbiGii toxin family protein [Nanoarchaeota archaeon]|nr:nucleotidyl transferase AbiEii/AbiGii toxin family protein [Nanoarchaeota archaeon]
MDEIKKITKDRLTEVASIRGFAEIVMTKDYYATAILYLLKDIEGIYFKGGTALQKIFLNYSRLSEDVDYTVTGDIEKIKKNIKDQIKTSDLFTKITKDKDVDNFTRLVCHYDKGVIFIDLNKRAKLIKQPEKNKINHFYTEEIPEFSVKTLSKDEMFAEKLSAAIKRNKPRDHFDIYMIIKNGFKFNFKLVGKKCKQSGCEFNIIKMFNNAKKLHNKWDEDMLPLLSKEIPFKEVIQTLAEYFNLKEEKDKLRN